MPKIIAYVNGAAEKELQNMPEDIAIAFGVSLNAIADDKKPLLDFKHLPTIGAGVIELIQNGSPAFRVLYCAKYLDKVYILHSFKKTTNGVDRPAMELAKKRYQVLMKKVQEAEKASKKKR